MMKQLLAGALAALALTGTPAQAQTARLETPDLQTYTQAARFLSDPNNRYLRLSTPVQLHSSSLLRAQGATLSYYTADAKMNMHPGLGQGKIYGPLIKITAADLTKFAGWQVSHVNFATGISNKPVTVCVVEGGMFTAEQPAVSATQETQGTLSWTSVPLEKPCLLDPNKTQDYRFGWTYEQTTDTKEGVLVDDESIRRKGINYFIIKQSEEKYTASSNENLEKQGLKFNNWVLSLTLTQESGVQAIYGGSDAYIIPRDGYFEFGADVSEAAVFNLLGQQVANNALPGGLYLVRARIRGSLQTFKLMIP